MKDNALERAYQLRTFEIEHCLETRDLLLGLPGRYFCRLRSPLEAGPNCYSHEGRWGSEQRITR